MSSKLNSAVELHDLENTVACESETEKHIMLLLKTSANINLVQNSKIKSTTSGKGFLKGRRGKINMISTITNTLH